MSEFSTSTIASLVLVGALWGCTNPLMKYGEAAQPEIHHPNKVIEFFKQTVATLTNWKFIIPFAINQSGSIMYVYLLGATEITMAVPICNSLTFVFTAITSRLLGEKPEQPFLTYTGMVVVLIGVSICFHSKL